MSGCLFCSSECTKAQTGWVIFLPRCYIHPCNRRMFMNWHRNHSFAAFLSISSIMGGQGSSVKLTHRWWGERKKKKKDDGKSVLGCCKRPKGLWEREEVSKWLTAANWNGKNTDWKGAGGKWACWRRAESHLRCYLLHFNLKTLNNKVFLVLPFIFLLLTFSIRHPWITDIPTTNSSKVQTRKPLLSTSVFFKQ